MKQKSIFLWFGLLLLAGQFSYAQTFKLLRYDEDYSGVKDSARSFYNGTKYIPLNKTGSTYLSLGGEVRINLDRAANEDWGAVNSGTDLYTLQRYNLHADLHLGNRVRIFSQLRSGLEFGRKNGPRPIDEDQLNIQNLFVDYIPWNDRERSITVRLGRQEIQYGSGRIIDVREGPNLRQYFDGAKVAYASASFRADGFIFSNGGVRNGVFDNKLITRAGLWGLYTTWYACKALNLDMYYLGINRKNAVFDEGVADERRHTFGVRLFRTEGALFYNLEGAYQLGKFGNGAIRAWGGSSEIGYRLLAWKGSPAIKLKSDFISGDDVKGDGKLGTSNALFPNGGYFGMNPQVGPGNLWSVHPNISWNPAGKLLLSAEAVFYWRQSLQDGIYRPDGTFNLSSSGSTGRYIGTAYITTATWTINRFLTYNLGIQYFETGNFINDVIPQHKDGFFMSSLIQFKF